MIVGSGKRILGDNISNPGGPSPVQLEFATIKLFNLSTQFVKLVAYYWLKFNDPLF